MLKDKVSLEPPSPSVLGKGTDKDVLSPWVVSPSDRDRRSGQKIKEKTRADRGIGQKRISAYVFSLLLCIIFTTNEIKYMLLIRKAGKLVSYTDKNSVLSATQQLSQTMQKNRQDTKNVVELGYYPAITCPVQATNPSVIRSTPTGGLSSASNIINQHWCREPIALSHLRVKGVGKRGPHCTDH